MGKELLLVNRVIDNLKEFGVTCQKHEDQFSVGIPDVSYDILGMSGSGWIEFKRLPEWPAKDDTKIKIEHFTPQQRNWLYKHGEINRRCFLLIQIKDTTMIYDWKVVYSIGDWDRGGMLYWALNFWNDHIDYHQLYLILRGQNETPKRYIQPGHNRPVCETQESDGSCRNIGMFSKVDIQCIKRNKGESTTKRKTNRNKRKKDLLSLW